jgi:hypothetical protein
VRARGALELARHALLMQTSCGWFFDQLDGREPVQVLRHAARALELAAALGRRLEDEFMARLEPARSDLPPYEDGAALYRWAARGEAATPARVGATTALLAVLGCEAEVPGFEVRLSAAPVAGRLVADAKVKEAITGALSRVSVEATRGAAAEPTCRTDAGSFGLDDLFAVQRERVAASLARTVAGTRDSEPVPEAWLADESARALSERLAELPGAAAEVLALLDRAEAARLPLDLGPAQAQMFAWWRAHASPADRAACHALALRLRLAVEV